MDIGRWRVSLFRSAVLIAVLVMVLIKGGVLITLATFGMLVIFAVVSLWPKEVHENAFYIAIAVYFAAFYVVGDADAELGFYEAAAQIIPVLFLAMAVGSRLLSLTGREEVDRRVRLVLIYTFVLGEWYSVDAIAAGKAREWAFAFVVAALSAAGAVVIAEVVGRDEKPHVS
jgi:hypothetical protein